MKTGLNHIMTLIGLSMAESSVAPEFGPYNTLMCRPGKIASFPLNASISQSGLVVAMDFYPYFVPLGSGNQTVFSIRNTATNFISLRVDYIRNMDILIVWVNGSNSPLPISVMSSIPVLRGKSKISWVVNFFQ